MESAKKLEESYDITDYLIGIEEDMTSTSESYYEIKYNNEVIGNIFETDLKNYLKISNKETEEILVRKSSEEEFVNAFSLPVFQRRKPQLISTEELSASNEIADDEAYFILVKGQKKGPYTKEDINQFLNNKEILMTDLISSNAGHTWMKLYQVNSFERRQLKESEHLPELPSSDFFSKEYSNESETSTINNEVDAVTGLLYLGNLKRGKIIEREKESLLETELTQKKSFSLLWKLTLITSIIGCIYFAFSMQKFLKSPFKNSDSSVGEQAEMLTPVDANFDSNDSSNSGDHFSRSPKIINRNLEPIKFNPANRKSFLNNAKMNQGGAQFTDSDENSYYYDNNTNPVELDPVRSQLSRETTEEPAAIAEPAPAPAPSDDPLFNQEINN